MTFKSFSLIVFLFIVMAFTFAFASDGYIHITWDAVTVDMEGNPEDIIYYYIYCDANPYLEPLEEFFIGATSGNVFLYYDARLQDPEIQLHFLVTAVDAFGNQSSGSSDFSLPVKLSAFTLSEENGQVLIKWITQSETDLLGFNLYRSTDINKNFIKINPAIIPGQGNSTSITEYTYQDSCAAPLQVHYYKLESVQTDGQVTCQEIKNIYVSNGKPDRFVITQNYPNPFNPHTNIDYAVPEEGWVKITIYNARGERIKELVNSSQQAGLYSIQWDACDDSGCKVASGVYFYKIKANGFTEIKKMVLTK